MTHPLFLDKKLEIHKDFVIIKDYYAPRFDKKLGTSDIEKVWVENLSALSFSEAQSTSNQKQYEK